MEADFFSKVFDVVRTIPYGRVTTYGAIARTIGAPGAARMVGWALNQSSYQVPFVPAHRVVNRNGLLTGKVHFPGFDTMSELLENEGVEVVDDCVVHFKQLFWDPMLQL
jgi:methylated-DNA-protein-cysteine methyltransferase-like protein